MAVLHAPTREITVHWLNLHFVWILLVHIPHSVCTTGAVRSSKLWRRRWCMIWKGPLAEMTPQKLKLIGFRPLCCRRAHLSGLGWAPLSLGWALSGLGWVPKSMGWPSQARNGFVKYKLGPLTWNVPFQSCHGLPKLAQIFIFYGLLFTTCTALVYGIENGPWDTGSCTGVRFLPPGYDGVLHSAEIDVYWQCNKSHNQVLFMQ